MHPHTEVLEVCRGEKALCGVCRVARSRAVDRWVSLTGSGLVLVDGTLRSELSAHVFSLSLEQPSALPRSGSLS